MSVPVAIALVNLSIAEGNLSRALAREECARHRDTRVQEGLSFEMDARGIYHDAHGFHAEFSLPSIEQHPDQIIAALQNHTFRINHVTLRDYCDPNSQHIPVRLDGIEVSADGRVTVGVHDEFNNQIVRTEITTQDVSADRIAEIARLGRAAAAAQIRHSPDASALTEQVVNAALMASGSQMRVAHTVADPSHQR